MSELHRSLMLSAVERWSRIHSGGFLKAAKEVAAAKRDQEAIENFTKFDKMPSVLKDKELRQRAKTRIDIHVKETLEILFKTLADFRSTEEATRIFSPEISDIMLEELRLREATVADLAETNSSDVLSQIIVLISELDNYLVARYSAQNHNLLPATVEEFKSFLRVTRCVLFRCL